MSVKRSLNNRIEDIASKIIGVAGSTSAQIFAFFGICLDYLRIYFSVPGKIGNGCWYFFQCNYHTQGFSDSKITE